jgi:hypothetical protein
MILEFGNNQNKPGRCRYFEMRINLGITGPKANLWVNATTLIDALARAIKILDLVVSKEIYPERFYRTA